MKQGASDVFLLRVPLRAHCMCAHKPQLGQPERLPVWVCFLGCLPGPPARLRGSRELGSGWEQPTSAALPLSLAS